jgi:hypothetical protein
MVMKLIMKVYFVFVRLCVICLILSVMYFLLILSNTCIRERDDI